ncbi:zinc finger BED domain-containing protein RICESLEEPER 2-like [Beta vulgaris subsp. vulgaris]|uniref:zinc finger BED domain-containing protein RICESLEEPER 2-like n=1 Tax=Beta vulgaris subsp. vulgaris TaxID=3555 RepID=UPI002036F302|nr:zinc finger BED domain-containing protein RICESLEEPER 2-like [Beta vulgaris subsp. vulgaris]
MDIDTKDYLYVSYRSFIDNDWKLNKRILIFFISSHKGEAIGKDIEKCLLAWGIENVMTVTADNASSNDTAIVYPKKRLNNWRTSVVKGEFLHVRCIAHIMNLVVTDGVKLVSDSLHRVQNAVRFVRSSSNRVEKFKRCAVVEKISTQSMLYFDVPTRWNSTYLMLNTAIKFINSFERFDGEDNHYHDDLWDVNGYGNGLGKPVFEDWDHVKNLIILLEAFYSLTLRVSGSLYVTSDTYFHECDKYWGDPTKFDVMLFLSAVLDPRYKWEWECVEYGIYQMYETDVALVVCTRVKKAFRDIFYEYSHRDSLGANRPTCTQTGVPYFIGVGVETSKENKAIIRARYKKLKATKEDGDSKSEIEKYLDEETVEDVDDFDILERCKTNTLRFPTLSLIAHDVLAIPVSTVASESAFSTEGRALDHLGVH